MKTSWIAVIGVLAAAVCGANGQQLKDGPHAGFATGDDVRNEEFAFGWQVAYENNDVLSLELSATRQTDEIEHFLGREQIPAGFSIGLEVYSIVLSARLSYRPLARLGLYAGGGLGYYIMKTDAEEVREAIAARPGYSTDPGVVLKNYNADVENDFGWHAAGGIELRILDNWEIFAEYRHIFLEPGAKLEITYQSRSGDPWDYLVTDFVEDKLEYNHGLIRVGVNYLF